MTTYQTIDNNTLLQLQKIVGVQHLHTQKDILEQYGKDRTEDLLFLPEAVVIPQTVEQISQIMQHCHTNSIPVTPRGAGTGLAGGALPVQQGLVLSMEKFDKILDIDEQNLQVTTEPGVITEVLQDQVLAKGLYYPPDPSSKGTSFIGGNVATNAGGPRAVKYGVVKDYVLNLQVVLPTGEVIWTGANTLKNSTGYNLTQLMVGSEGTLGIITKIVLKLVPAPHHSLLLLAAFPSATKACAAVSAIFRVGVVPSCLEFMERDAIDIARNYLGNIDTPIDEQVQAHLLIEVDGQDLEALYKECERLNEVLEAHNTSEVLFADNDSQKKDFWQLRRNISNAIKQHSAVKKADTVVPRAALAELLAGVKIISKKYGTWSVCYGHAGDGNLHINLLKGDLPDDKWENEVPQAIHKIFELVVRLKGTISGEHGVGWIQRQYMSIAFSEAELALMRAIKKTFDPKLILNPQKIV